MKSRNVTVRGPRGTLVRIFRHLPVDISLPTPKLLKGFLYKMRAVCAHFPINVDVSNANTKAEIKNFLGKKFTHLVDMLKGVSFQPSGNMDKFIQEGNDIELISGSTALIQQSTSVKKKDIRKILDGIYVSEKTTVLQN
ncbi:hypothetical protein BsWGS_25408 [Bradybaena similaris]